MIAVMTRDDLATWQKLNVTALQKLNVTALVLTGITGAITRLSARAMRTGTESGISITSWFKDDWVNVRVSKRGVGF